MTEVVIKDFMWAGKWLTWRIIINGKVIFFKNHPHFSFPVTEKWTFYIQDPRPLKQWHNILKQPWFWGSKSRFPIPGQPRMDCSCQICLREQPGGLQGRRTQLPEFRMFCSTAAVLLFVRPAPLSGDRTAPATRLLVSLSCICFCVW